MPSSPAFVLDNGNYDSSFESEDEQEKRKKKKEKLLVKDLPKPQPLVPSSYYTEQYEKEARRSMQSQLRNLTAYDRHKMLINQYYMSVPGRAGLFKRDSSKDKRDLDVIRENHQFLWEESDVVDTWGKQLAKKYYDKLFKEYCICDLRRYKENKVGLRWRVEKEVVSGKGQFSCGEQSCKETKHLRTWEVNFAYLEHNTKKNTLVKIRLCDDCSYKLNYHHKKKEVTQKKKKHKKEKKKEKRRSSSRVESRESGSTLDDSSVIPESEMEEPKPSSSAEQEPITSTEIWREAQQTAEEKSRDEEFEEYLEDLFL
nr:EOG090X0H59 [Macrothrix elegans]